MADITTELHNDIREMRGMLTQLVSGQARTAEAVENLNDRLYKDGGGAIPSLFTKTNAIANDIVAWRAESVAAIAVVDRKVEIKRAYLAGWIAAATLLLGGVKYALAKVGVHIP